jgi:phytanoyl-CoA dioxygenase PhyH
MQRSFNVCLKQLRWNNYDGYEKTEPYRHMVEDILTLDQGFVDATLHPMVTGVLRSYLGDRFELVEAKGWKSIPSRRDFHGWHADAWYDQNGLTEIPKEVKLAIYLTNVKTGAFNYIRRSHRQQHPRMVKAFELQDRTKSEILELTGPAGTAFLFDTSGIHRQSVPILEPRCAVFYNYHDPSVKLDRENIEHYRYHPLLLNAAFLGGLSEEDARILGFGNTTNYIPAFANPVEPGILHKAFNMAHNLNLFADKYVERVRARLDKLRS